MVTTTVAIVSLILDSLYAVGPGRGRSVSFMFGDVGSRFLFPQSGAELHVDHSCVILAALAMRQEGPPYLRKLPIDEIRSMIISFVTEHYAILAPEVFFSRFDGPYSTVISDGTKSKLANALERSRIWRPTTFVTLYPLVPLRVVDSFDSSTFFFQAPSALTHGNLGIARDAMKVTGSHFPPDTEWRHRKYPVTSWLGIRAPARQAADRQRASILGAFALTLPELRRYMCSGREMMGGWCTFNEEGMTMAVTDAMTPALADDYEITRHDHPWMSLLAQKLEDTSAQTIREMKALEYYYRSWFLNPAERFPALYMALESVFGDVNRATQAVIDGVRNLLGHHVNDARLRLLSGLRATVIHGGAPEVYDSSKYAKYFRQYHDDPIRDLELIVTACLRQRIFMGAMAERPDPHAARIAEAITAGRMPPLKRSSILDIP